MADTPEDVADLLDVVAHANGRLMAEVDGLIGSRAAVSDRIINRLQRLTDDLRPGAVARAELSELADLDIKLLLHGMSVWVQRRHQSRGAGSRALQRRGGASA